MAASPLLSARSLFPRVGPPVCRTPCTRVSPVSNDPSLSRFISLFCTCSVAPPLRISFPFVFPKSDHGPRQNPSRALPVATVAPVSNDRGLWSRARVLPLGPGGAPPGWPLNTKRGVGGPRSCICHCHRLWKNSVYKAGGVSKLMGGQ